MDGFDQTISEIAARHGVSEGSIRQLAQGLLSTGGGQVQFNVPEFGGIGQWMPGIVMTSDLFNTGLRMRVDTVCSDISNMVRAGQLRPPQPIAPAGGGPSVSLSWSGHSNWWPGDLGVPATSGAQNNLRYAWFPGTRRLAIDLGGSVWVYDTGDHQIGGVSQQQSGGGMTLTFTSQYGVVKVSALPVVSRNS
jgi:hypothetical protein